MIKVDAERGAIVVHGSVPGKPGNVLEITPAKIVGVNFKYQRASLNHPTRRSRSGTFVWDLVPDLWLRASTLLTASDCRYLAQECGRRQHVSLLLSWHL